MMTVSQRVHSGPGFFQPWIVPRWTTMSPGWSRRVSDPSSMTRISLPLTSVPTQSTFSRQSVSPGSLRML